MTKTLNDNRRELMATARKLAGMAQATGVPGLIRGDVIKVPYEDLVDMFILLAGVCPVEYMEVADRPDLVPCAGCDRDMLAQRSGRRYCSEACRRVIKSEQQYRRRSS